jgi:hypothetical protein
MPPCSARFPVAGSACAAVYRKLLNGNTPNGEPTVAESMPESSDGSSAP